jgi:hypothetical protein
MSKLMTITAEGNNIANAIVTTPRPVNDMMHINSPSATDLAGDKILFPIAEMIEVIFDMPLQSNFPLK